MGGGTTTTGAGAKPGYEEAGDSPDVEAGVGAGDPGKTGAEPGEERTGEAGSEAGAKLGVEAPKEAGSMAGSEAGSKAGEAGAVAGMEELERRVSGGATRPGAPLV